MLLEGKVAFITGGAHGIGRAIASRYLEEGAKVAIADCDRDGGVQTARELTDRGFDVLFCQVDVTDETSLQAGLKALLDAFGRLDIVVANAGVNYDGPVVDTPLNEWQRVIKINLTGVFLTAKVLSRHLIAQKEGGRIIFASSEAGKKGEAGAAAYCASKFGVIGLLQSLALELAPHGITVNGVCPGMIDSDMLRWLARTQASSQGRPFEELWHEYAAGVPLGRLGTLEEVANIYLFLASSLGDYVTGETVNVDGGRMPG